MSCREVVSAWPVPDGLSLNRVSRVGFRAGFGGGFLDRNLLDGIPRDGPSRTDRPELTDIWYPPFRSTDTLSALKTPVNKPAPAVDA